jgi:hypothetical protein
MTGDVPYPGGDEHSAIEFLTATNDGTAIDGWHWLIEWTTTSFYIKSMNPAIQAMKVSMHGPDPRPQHRGKEHFRFDLERTNQYCAAREVAAGARWLSDTGGLPHYFEGRKVNDNVKLIVRFSVGYDAYVAGAPAAGGSDSPVQDAMKGIVPWPPEGRVSHVDIFLSDDGEPYWPDEAKSELHGQAWGSSGIPWTGVFQRSSSTGPSITSLTRVATFVVTRPSVSACEDSPRPSTKQACCGCARS